MLTLRAPMRQDILYERIMIRRWLQNLGFIVFGEHRIIGRHVLERSGPCWLESTLG
jgi:hypothetical protein